MDRRMRSPTSQVRTASKDKSQTHESTQNGRRARTNHRVRPRNQVRTVGEQGQTQTHDSTQNALRTRTNHRLTDQLRTVGEQGEITDFTLAVLVCVFCSCYLRSPPCSPCFPPTHFVGCKIDLTVSCGCLSLCVLFPPYSRRFPPLSPLFLAVLCLVVILIFVLFPPSPHPPAPLVPPCSPNGCPTAPCLP